MFSLYVIYSNKFDKFYIGFSSNVEKRVEAHNHPKNKGWTRSFKPWKIIYTESYYSKTEAMKREKKLKSSKGREFIRKIIENEK